MCDRSSFRHESVAFYMHSELNRHRSLPPPHSSYARRSTPENDVVSQSVFHRRLFVQTTLFTLIGPPTLTHDDIALGAEETAAVPQCIVSEFSITDKIFFDISIDRENVGRIVVGLYGENVPIGAQRFSQIAIGSKGISYRKKEFFKVTPSFIQNAGLRSFSLSGENRDSARFIGGENAESLLPELDNLNRICPNTIKNSAGSVSIVVRDVEKPPPKPKLVAKDGKFKVIQEEVRPDPNGTQFTICLKDSPELDSGNLVVGRIIDGFDVLKAISSVKVVQENTSSPYFK